MSLTSYWLPASIFAVLLTAMAAVPGLGDVARGATLPVTKNGDTNDGVCDSDCSLREAIAASSPGDTVVIPAGTYTLTLGSELVIGKDLILAGAGADSTIIQAATQRGVATHRVFNIAVGTVAISGVTIRYGVAPSGIESGFSSPGGGIFNRGTLTLTNSTISGNISSVLGGGILTAGAATIANSTISGNISGRGGGVWTDGRLNLTNSTISANRAGDSGGIYNVGTLVMTNSTVSTNTASAFGGGVLSNGNLVVTNSIIAGNTSPLGPDCYDILISLGRNLIGNTAGCRFMPASGDLVDIDPKLGPLQNNGGLTETHALPHGSPAIDAGDDSQAPPTDQRGVPRPQGPHSDIGAFELAVPTVSFASASQSVAEGAGTATITVGRSAASSQSVTVPFTLSGTATGGGTDYTITNSPLTIAAGQTSATLTVTLVDNSVDEPDKTVVVTLGTPTNATLGATTTHTLTITDDDAAPPPALAGRFKVNVSCPPRASRGTMVNATVTFTNSTPVDRAVTRGALALHVGQFGVLGPRAFSVSVPVPVATTAGAPGRASTTVPILMPSQARAGSFVSVGLSFFGQVDSNPRRKHLGTGGCVIEIVP